MTPSAPREVLTRVRKLVLLPEEVKQSRWAISVTRLTIVKSLCQEQEVANRFVTYLARKTLEHVQKGKGRSAHPDNDEQRLHRKLMTDALEAMEAWLKEQDEVDRVRLWDLLSQMKQQQNKFQNIKWGAVRIVNDWDLLLFEYALSCLVHPEREAPFWAYQTARHYAERYSSSQGDGLVSASVPLLQDIADFWLAQLGLDRETFLAPTPRKKPRPPVGEGKKRSAARKKPHFTHRQGQFLAFIHLYRLLHRQGPTEHDLAVFFRLTLPSVHGMMVKLEERGLITREPAVPRSARVAIPEREIPPLEAVKGPPWPE